MKYNCPICLEEKWKGKVALQEVALGRGARLTLAKMRRLTGKDSRFPYANIDAAIAALQHDVFGRSYSQLSRKKKGSRQARYVKGKRIAESANRTPKSLRNAWSPCDKHVKEFISRWSGQTFSSTTSKSPFKLKRKHRSFENIKYQASDDHGVVTRSLSKKDYIQIKQKF